MNGSHNCNHAKKKKKDHEKSPKVTYLFVVFWGPAQILHLTEKPVL